MRIILIFLCLISISAFSQNPITDYDIERDQWVDSIINKLTLDEKIGQLFMVAAYSNKDKKHEKKILKFIKKYHIGGLIFFKGSAENQINLTNKYQKHSKIPLMIGLDAEWGLGMRLNEGFSYPWAMTSAAIKNNDLIYQMGKQIAKHSKRMGIHINFAPVADINTNPNNPIIGNRAFGSNKDNVAEKAIAYANGIQSENILACAKHFPGHGDTSQDSHLELPIVHHKKDRIYTQELYPFKKIINNGISSIMVAHLQIPSLDTNPKTASSLSKNIINDVLKNKLFFGGLIFTDALNMKAVTSLYPSGELEAKAFSAGNDVLLFPENIPKAILKIKEKINSGKISILRLEYSVRKILNAKYWVGLNSFKPIKSKNIFNDINTLTDRALYRKIAQKSITVIRNYKYILPIKYNNKKIALISLDEEAKGKVFEKYIKKMHQIDVLKASKRYLNHTLKKLKDYDLIIIGVHKLSIHPWKNYKLSDWEKNVIKLVSQKSKVILDIFASPYSLINIYNELKDVESIVISYQNNDAFQELSAQTIFGVQAAEGNLPIHLNDDFFLGKGHNTPSIDRLGFSIPEAEGMDTNKLANIDTLINRSIKDTVMPGAQLIIAKNGKVIYQKSYGYHTYKKQRKVLNSDIYDLASITKIAATTSILMKMVQEGYIHLDDDLGTFFPQSIGTNKENLSIRKMFSHFAKLKPWIPLHLETIEENGKYKKGYYSKYKDKKYSIQVAHKMYLNKNYRDSIIKKILLSDLLEKEEYKYSGLPFIIMKYIIENIYEKDIGMVAEELFYKPLGATTLCYNPIGKFNKNRIPPTEDDTIFRKQIVKGYVHDMIAALQGGLGGNAGLFSNAYDLCKMMQMLLNAGKYAGKDYIDKYIIDEFNTRYYSEGKNRRGIGFDKPQFEGVGSTCGCVSHESFGHMGFTGTMAWADPNKKIVYIFLSNRTYPYSSNKKISEQNLRTEIQRLIYESIIE